MELMVFKSYNPISIIIVIDDGIQFNTTGSYQRPGRESSVGYSPNATIVIMLKSHLQLGLPYIYVRLK